MESVRKNRCYFPCHKLPGVYPTTRRKPCSTCGHVNSDGYMPGSIRDGWELRFTDDERAVLEVLREHPRNVLTLTWGIHELTSRQIAPSEVRHALNLLEQKGLARESSFSEEHDEWWRLTRVGKELAE